MSRYYDEIDFKTVSELVDLGKVGGMVVFAAYVNSIEKEVRNEISPEAELHPDWMDAIFEAAEQLGWDEKVYFKALGWG